MARAEIWEFITRERQADETVVLVETVSETKDFRLIDPSHPAVLLEIVQNLLIDPIPLFFDGCTVEFSGKRLEGNH